MNSFKFGKSAMKGKKKTYKAKIDVVFKMLFGDPKNKVILSDFLQAILGLSNDDVSEIDILNPFLRLEDINGKLGILDINLTTKSGKIIDIEMQVRKVASMHQRCCTMFQNCCLVSLKTRSRITVL